MAEDLYALLDDEGQDLGGENVLYEETPPQSSPLQRAIGVFTPVQWFFLSFLLFLTLCLMSFACLLLTGRMAL